LTDAPPVRSIPAAKASPPVEYDQKVWIDLPLMGAAYLPR
jgi:hypothetical protein